MLFFFFLFLRLDFFSFGLMCCKSDDHGLPDSRTLWSFYPGYWVLVQ